MRSFVKNNFLSIPHKLPSSPIDCFHLTHLLREVNLSYIVNFLSVNGGYSRTSKGIMARRPWTSSGMGRKNEFTLPQSVLDMDFCSLRYSRLYLSKLKLSRMFPSVDSSYDRCEQTAVSLAHVCFGNVLSFIIIGFQFFSQCQPSLEDLWCHK